MSPGSLSGEERLTLLQRESLAAITALNPQIRELSWGPWVSENIHPNLFEQMPAG